jgi:hypothetical protein
MSAAPSRSGLELGEINTVNVQLEQSHDTKRFYGHIASGQGVIEVVLARSSTPAPIRMRLCAAVLSRPDRWD